MRKSTKSILSRIELPCRFNLDHPSSCAHPLGTTRCCGRSRFASPWFTYAPQDSFRTLFARILPPRDDARLPCILHYLIAHQAAGCKSWAAKEALHLWVKAAARWNTRIDRSSIPGPAGPLEARLEWNPEITPHHAALVCHPHPLHGGTMHNKVVLRAAKAALELGLPALRFNFRGAGRSAGTFTSGIGERGDVRAALDFLSARFPGLAVCVIGFSFGSWVGLEVGATDPRVSALVGLGVPVLSFDFGFLLGIRKPKLLIQGTRDKFGPRTEIQTLYDCLAEPKQIHWVHEADHFFTGTLAEVQKVLRDFLLRITSQRREAEVR